jgi:SPP1 gp7 family putative phage head morphogenesis protein
MDEGLGIAAIARNLRKNFKDMADSELIRVARTEVNGVQQEANWQSHQQAQIAYLQWISSRDKRTRESHARMNGQIIPATGRFSNGLRYPGDRTGSIKEWINCRCRTAPFVMPLGKMAPAGKPYFYKQDLVSVPSSEFTQSFI